MDPMVHSSAQPPSSADKIGLIDDAAGLAAGDADEDPCVQPGEMGRSSLDLGQGAEGVLAGVDILTTSETCEDLGAAVVHTP
jgi:hypothetical protein